MIDTDMHFIATHIISYVICKCFKRDILKMNRPGNAFVENKLWIQF